MSHSHRRRTINSKGEVVAAPYGPSRWSSPKRYTCTHQDCPNPATVLKTANAHTPAPDHDSHDPTTTRAHNCCGNH